jgi:hypothetical protein
MEIKKYGNFLLENIDYEDINEKLKDKELIELKINLIESIESNIKVSENENINLRDIENFVDDYLSAGKDASMIAELTDDNDIFNFYLKFQSEIDELLNDKEYMDKSPKENNVFGLYDVVIDGTKTAIISLLENIKDELF